ncbi:unnamed protein product [Euphydryas editha]|uniref:Uncharacterized protein n=1 Tax=Euphydryas editha TaxID=104508 RepID=A0AAU9USH5_EUPED|nr:unnamed protein product [Euphydryas editha]
MLRRSAHLSKYVTSEKFKKARLMGIVCDPQYLLTSMPLTADNMARTEYPRAPFPEVWRDRHSASIQLTSTPEARSLTSL